MTRFFAYLAVLLPVCLITTLSTSFFVFHRVDLSFTAFAGIILAPLFQAAVLAGEAASPWRSLAAAARAVRSESMAVPVLAIDGVVLAAGLVAWSRPVIGFGADATIQPAWVAIKGLAAAGFLVAAARALARRARVAVAGVVLLAVAVGANVVWSWLAGMPRATAAWLRIPGIAGRVLVDGTLIALFLLLMRSLARSADTRCPGSAALLRVAAACAVAGATVDALAAFNHRDVVPPWSGGLALCASLAATFVFLAALTAAGEPNGGARR